MNDKSIIGLIVLLSTGIIAAIFIIGAQQQQQPAARQDVVPTPTFKAVSVSENGRLYQLIPDASTARFRLGELLRGTSQEVVGTTSGVSGQLAVNLADLSTADVGTITVDAANLDTDNGIRNRAIHAYILVSSAYPTITFTPAAISGLDGAASPGDTFTFEMTGLLTITIFSREETFNVTATAVSPERIAGTATAVIQRSDYELAIPNATGVADVDETITLELDFIAEAVGGD